MAFFDSLLSGDYTSAIIQGGAQIGGALIAANANADAASAATAGKTAAANITSDAAIQAANIQKQSALDAAGITAQSNKDALNQYLQFNQQGRDELNASKARGLAAIDAGTAGYAATINPLLTPNPIVLPTYRGLTAQQQTGEQDLLRNSKASLAASGLRGAGRAGVAAIMDQDRRYQEDARAGNDTDTRNEQRRAQSVANNAVSGLAGIQASSAGAKANTELGTGNSLASTFSNAGTTAAGLTSATGQANANAVTSGGNAVAGATNTAGTANANAVDSNATTTAQSGLADAKLTGQTIGSLGSIIAGQLSAGPIGSSSGTSNSDANKYLYGSSSTGTA
jgi:hypothetical protein